MKIVFLDASTMGNVSLEKIRRQGELVCYPTSTPEEAIQRVGDCDVLIINKIKVTRELIEAAPKLKLVCEASTMGIGEILAVPFPSPARPCGPRP
ncbi:MAG: hypothetical protein J5520_07100, partial [Bacteroidales bacterium]|nr:hypothetical protein [Bacteroidales bacterium]